MNYNRTTRVCPPWTLNSYKIWSISINCVNRSWHSRRNSIRNRPVSMNCRWKSSRRKTSSKRKWENVRNIDWNYANWSRSITLWENNWKSRLSAWAKRWRNWISRRKCFDWIWDRFVWRSNTWVFEYMPDRHDWPTFRIVQRRRNWQAKTKSRVRRWNVDNRYSMVNWNLTNSVSISRRLRRMIS